ncbi:hypothetical protein ABZ341_36025 [Streptomyces sp. NPDC006173]
MSESDKGEPGPHPIPRDRPDQQARPSDPLNIKTMVRRAHQKANDASSR